MTTDQILGDGQLTFTGSAGPEILASVLTEPGDTPVVAFGDGSIDIYDLSSVDLGPVSGALDVGIGGTVGIWVGGDLASLTDFAFYPATEPDPAMAIAVADNNGTVSAGSGNAWSRHYMTLYAPTDNVAWKRAAYAAVGLVYKAMPAGGIQYLDDVQWEIAPVAKNVPAPYSPARSLDVWVEPTRLNHSTNPSFEVDLTDWTSPGEFASLTRITTDAAQGTACCRVTGWTVGEAVEHVVKTLTPGRRYTASLYVQSLDGGDLRLKVRGVTDDATGIVDSPMSWQSAPPGTLVSPDWRRLWVSFTPVSTTVSLWLINDGASSALFDGALVEEGNGLKPYFDGDSGSPDYVWELDGTPGKARSYYYRDKLNRHYILGKTLRENVQLGLVVGDPIYADSASSTTTPYGGGPGDSGPYGSGPYGG